jgi:hypothetical protein
MILGKFLKDFGRNKKAKGIIEEIVTDYFTKEKVTEDSLKALKARVREATVNVKGSCMSLLIQKSQRPIRRVLSHSRGLRSLTKFSNRNRSPVRRSKMTAKVRSRREAKRVRKTRTRIPAVR